MNDSFIDCLKETYGFILFEMSLFCMCFFQIIDWGF